MPPPIQVDHKIEVSEHGRPWATPIAVSVCFYGNAVSGISIAGPDKDGNSAEFLLSFPLAEAVLEDLRAAIELRSHFTNDVDELTDLRNRLAENRGDK